MGNSRSQPPRKRPTQQRSRATFDAIVAAATRILSQGGYAAFNTNRVAEEAGVSVGSLYQYFGDKEGLIAEIVQRFTAEILAVLRRDLALARRVPLEVAVRGLVRAILDVHRVDPQLHRVLKDEVRLTPTLGALAEYEAAVLAILYDEFEFRREELRALDPKLCASILAHAVEAAVRAYVLDPEHPGEEDAFCEELSLLVLGFIRR